MLYDKSLLVNRVCNETVCSLLAALHRGFNLTAVQLEKTSGERHGAIRIGKAAEYRWVCRFFAAFAMEPHNFYDMTNVGAKSQPIVATAFRSRLHPDHRIFCSLLMTDYFDPATRARIEALLAPREVFSAAARALLEQSERQGQIRVIRVLIDVVEVFKVLDKLLSDPGRKDEVAGMILVHERT